MKSNKKQISSYYYEVFKTNKIETDNPEVNSLKIQVSKIDNKIEDLVSQFSNISDITINYLDEAIKKLDSEKKMLKEKINDTQLKANRGSEVDIDIGEVINSWSEYEMQDKKTIAKKVIEKIILDGEEINIIFY